MRRLCVFCGSSFGRRPEYAQAAANLGRVLVDSGFALVYGGAHVGLMGLLADTVLDAGGEVTGVIPRSMVEREIAHHRLTHLHVVGTMHERKALMADLSDAFLAMPGAYGTLDEFFEILTWAQLGIHEKPCGILNIANYFDRLLAFLDHTAAEGFLKPANRALFVVDTEPRRLLDRMAEHRPRREEKWMSPKVR